MLHRFNQIKVKTWEPWSLNGSVLFTIDIKQCCFYIYWVQFDVNHPFTKEIARWDPAELEKQYHIHSASPLFQIFSLSASCSQLLWNKYKKRCFLDNLGVIWIERHRFAVLYFQMHRNISKIHQTAADNTALVNKLGIDNSRVPFVMARNPFSWRPTGRLSIDVCEGGGWANEQVRVIGGSHVGGKK